MTFDSFDILRDTLGLVRTEFPHTVYFIAGTQVSFISLTHSHTHFFKGCFINQIGGCYYGVQAEQDSWNSIGIFKVSNISGKRRELVPKLEADDSGVDGEESDSEDDSEDEDEDGVQGPTLQATSSLVFIVSLLDCFKVDLTKIFILFTSTVTKDNS